MVYLGQFRDFPQIFDTKIYVIFFEPHSPYSFHSKITLGRPSQTAKDLNLVDWIYNDFLGPSS